MTIFSDDLLFALGSWQFGWREQQDQRQKLAIHLLQAVKDLPQHFRQCDDVCYRKRFIHTDELLDIVLRDGRDEGVVSWTTDRRFAERFKGLHRPGAVCGAIFEHMPTGSDVVVSYRRLWEDSDFNAAAEAYRLKNGVRADALFHFKDSQSEVVLTAPLIGSEIVALAGASSPFDELCDIAGIAQPDRDRVYRDVISQGVYPGEYQYTSKDSAQRVIQRSIARLFEKISSLRSG